MKTAQIVQEKEETVQVENTSSSGDAAMVEDAIHVEGEIWNGINRKTVLAFLAICGQLNAYEMTLLIPAVAAPTINADLGPDPDYIWINIVWGLCAAILVSIGGRLSDIFGRRYFMLTGATISFLGTIVGATGRSIPQMIASGVMFGVGSGFQEMGFACIMEFIPNKYRLTALGLYGTSALPCLFSPLLTYVFIARTSIGWQGAVSVSIDSVYISSLDHARSKRVIGLKILGVTVQLELQHADPSVRQYWFMCGFHAFAGAFLFCFYHPPTFGTKHKEDNVSKWKLVLEMDFVGLFLLTAGCALFLVGLSFGGRRFEWKSAPVIAPIIVGIMLIVLLFFWDFYANLKYPLFPHRLFKQWRGFAHEKRQILFFISAQILFIGLLSTVGVYDKGKAIALVFLMSCFINQPLYMLFNMVSLNLEDQRDMGVAIGAISTFRLLGGSIATAIYSSIVDNQFKGNLPKEISKAISGTGFDSANLRALMQAAAANTAKAYAAVPGITPQIIAASQFAVKLAYVKAFKVVYYTALGFAVLAIGSALLLRDIDPAKKNLDKAVVLENEKRKTFIEDEVEKV
ncbi:hypothetical protein H2200_009763 [Cladophialophora chaetospira]|uniref:Major facilitator superfamily (MFS) profile domain-containing protein n=1 Tax=Cladophialophora chaetospira TaxID=386627 RepID=A0AA39CF56_9EURO|nr:hypothetical protein H2200_009763 [Cladophialophora chaetospira]